MEGTRAIRYNFSRRGKGVQFAADTGQRIPFPAEKKLNDKILKPDSLLAPGR